MVPTYVAQPYVAGSPEATVSGAAMIAFVQNLRAKHIEPILKKYGLGTIDEDVWYSHQLWMDILKELDTRLGAAASEVFVAFGKQVVETAVMPPDIQSIPDALNALHAIHHANLRDVPETEGYSIERISATEYRVYHNTPNPDDAIYGFLWGMAARFRGPGVQFVVRKEEPSADAPYPGSVFTVQWWEENWAP